METYTIAGRKYQVLGRVTTPQHGTVPLVDLPLMSDEEWNRKARENAVRNYARKFGHPPETVEEAAEWQRGAIRRMEAEI